MKLSVLNGAFFLLCAVLASPVKAALTDEMAIEEGMTPVDQLNMNMDDLTGTINFERADYVSAYPSAEDIARVVQSHSQVLVINKRAQGPDAQTLRIYQNGVIKQLYENKISTKIVNGKKVKTKTAVFKDFVRISTGRETKEVATSGRHYFSTTPKGFFRPQRLYKMYYSNTWKADMPNAIFINCSRKNFKAECGIAIHATTPSHYAALGKRDSGGCIRTRQEVSDQIRPFIMDSGLGSQNKDFGIVKESYRRDRIANNTILVDHIDRDTGAILNQKVNSWDTVIVIYE